MSIRAPISAKRPAGGRRVSLCIVLALGVCFAAAPAGGETFTWVPGPLNDGRFEEPNCWLPTSGPPGAADTAVFDSAGTHEVTFSRDEDSYCLDIVDGETTFLLSGHTYSLWDGEEEEETSSINVGAADGRTGSLTVSGGELASFNAYLGATADANGTVTVDGTGSTWTNRYELYVGDEGAGTLSVTGGGQVSSSSSTVGHRADGNGTVTVAGDGSTWTNSDALSVGHYGRGSLSITGGGQVSSLNGYVASLPGANGTAVVSGVGSTWTNWSGLTVGGDGTGSLSVTGGGQVSSFDGYVGGQADSNGTVTVDGTGSTWTNSNFLYVGWCGTGSLSVTGGGQVSSSHGYVGYRHLDPYGALVDSNGTVTVDGTGSMWTNSVDLCVGGSDTAAGGAGEVTVSDGGVLEVGGRLKLWAGGVLEVTGGTIRFTESDPLALADGAFRLHFGTVEFDTDMVVGVGNATLGELFGSPFAIPSANELRITGQATLAAPVTLDGGTFSVGSLVNPGLLEFDSGTLRLTDANLVVGSGGLFGAALHLRPGRHVDVTHDAAVAAGGLLTGYEGRLSARSLTVQAGGEVSVGPGERLTVAGPAVNDGGQLTLGGGTLWFEGALTNEGGGLVMGNGLLRADGGITNAATMAFSGATDVNVVGDVTNLPEGLIIASGGGAATFFDDVLNDGEIRISESATAVFFGSYAGEGSFPGPGLACFEGDLKPGSSPGVVAFGGSVAFGSGATFEVELGDDDSNMPLAPTYDRLEVASDVRLAGTLTLTWEPTEGDPNSLFGGDYDIVIYGGDLDGEFSAVGGNLGEAYVAGIDYAADAGDGLHAVRITLYDLIDGDADLDGKVGRDDLLAFQTGAGLADPDWFTGDFDFDGDADAFDYLAWKRNAGNALPGAVIPEPATAALLCVAVATLLRKRRRRS